MLFAYVFPTTVVLAALSASLHEIIVNTTSVQCACDVK
jgi:hypothetical protein